MWELLRQRLMKLRSSWRDKLYSRMTIELWTCTGFPFVKMIVRDTSVLSCSEESEYSQFVTRDV